MMNGALRTSFIQCHQHGEGSEFFCHYKKEGQGEPDLEGDDDHDLVMITIMTTTTTKKYEENITKPLLVLLSSCDELTGVHGRQ